MTNPDIHSQAEKKTTSVDLAKAESAASKKAGATSVPRTTPTKSPIKVTAAKSVAKQPSKARKTVVAKATVQQPEKTSTKVSTEKASKQKKPKLVRDSFTIPKSEYSVLADLKQRAVKVGSPAKKSALLRAGIKALAAMSDVAFTTALAAVPPVKTDRSAKN